MIRPNDPPNDTIWHPLLTRDFARRVVDYRIDSDAQDRLADLREKANNGQLDDVERIEYAQLVEDLDLLAILQAKARSALERRAS